MRMRTVDALVWLAIMVALVWSTMLPWAEAAEQGKFSFQFFNVKLGQLTRVVLSDVVKVNYVFETNFLANDEEVSLDLRGVTREEALSVLFKLLDRHGYSAARTMGIVTVEKKVGKPDEEEVFFYRLRYRDLGYINDLIGALFPSGKFNFQHAGAANAVQTGGAAPAAGGAGTVYLSTPAAQAQSMTVSSGAAKTDVSSDAFFFRGSRKDIVRLKGLLDVVDVPVGEVMIKAVVYEVTTGSQDGSAVSIAASLLAGRFGISLGGASFADALSFHGKGIDAVVSALATDSRFKVVSAPSLRVKSGASGRFSVGNETPVLGSVSYQQNGSAVQSVDYRPSGVILDLKPVVRESGIELTINQQLSSFAATTTGVNASPTLSKREITTTVGVRDGEMVVLGGLSDERSTEAHTGFSFLPRWLRSHSGSADHIEVLLLLDVRRI